MVKKKKGWQHLLSLTAHQDSNHALLSATLINKYQFKDASCLFVANINRNLKETLLTKL